MILSVLALVAVNRAMAQDVPVGDRAIDLMWDCQGRGKMYQFAINSGASDTEFWAGVDKLFCVTYIDGIVDANALFVGLRGASFFCLPRTGLT